MEVGPLLLISAGGLAAGFLGALMGLGGGIVAIPFLNLVMGVPMRVASASGLVSTLATSCGASGRHLRSGGMIDVESMLPLQLLTALGALLGGLAAGWLPVALLQLLFAGVLLYGGAHIVRSAWRPEKNEAEAAALPGWPKVLCLVLFFLTGIASGLLGIGGGMLVVPILHLLMGVPFKNAVASSNFMMGLTATPALFAFAGRGELDLVVAVPLAAGVLAGANLGARLLPKIRTQLIKGVFALLLLVAAVQMVVRGLETW